MRVSSNETFPTQTDIADRIRQLRRQRGWSLKEVAKRSGGKITALAMGAYERSERSISLAKLIEIAELFSLPLICLIATPLARATKNLTNGRVIYDLRTLAKLPESEWKRLLTTYLQEIAMRRGDWGGEVLSLRATDLENIALALQVPSQTFISWVEEVKISLVKNY
jgi:transcriptional regulator with XRE-family HTH domain